MTNCSSPSPQNPSGKKTSSTATLIAAHYAGIPAAILLNKTDLLDDAATAALEARLAPYQALDIPVYRASLQENGVPADLAAWLQDKQTILCGQSGVGKSSLIRSLKPRRRQSGYKP